MKNTKSGVSNTINRVWLSQYFVRPNEHGNARSRPISEAKQGWAWLVLGWETAWEYQELYALLERERDKERGRASERERERVRGGERGGESERRVLHFSNGLFNSLASVKRGEGGDQCRSRQTGMERKMETGRGRETRGRSGREGDVVEERSHRCRRPPPSTPATTPTTTTTTSTRRRRRSTSTNISTRDRKSVV